MPTPAAAHPVPPMLYFVRHMRTTPLFPLDPAGPTALLDGPPAPPAARPLPPAPLPASRGVDLASIPTRTALTRQEGPSANWFDWSANPYRGCEFGCGYCYARSTHEWLGHADPRDFQERIYVKQGFAEALHRDLRARVRPGEHVAFGTATDPYQPVEAREGVMRAALREMARASGLRVSITTKSALVVRDIDLLVAVARRNAVQVNMTITTPDARLARFLEPRAPAPGARFEALRRLRSAGLRAGVFLMPVLPGVTDAEADLRTLFHQAAEAGSQFVAHQVVTLDGSSRAHFLASLRRAYPRIAARYEVWTRTGRTLPLDVRQEIASRVRGLARRFGIAGPGGRPGDESSIGPPPQPVAETQRLFEFVA